MRNALTTMALALLVSACSGGTTTGSTSIGTSTGTSTGISNGTTTGGATTGTPGLGAGAMCSSNQACASGVCGPDGTGNCCAEKCSTSNEVCGATACDATGACTYPAAGGACGDICSEGVVTQSTCDGNGGCVAGAPGACPGNFTCDSDGGCHTSCESIVDCAPNFACNALHCVPLKATGSCTEDDDCVSGICGIAGTGQCCANGCAVGTGAPCGATGCDDAGACSYPAKDSACGSGTASCTDNSMTNLPACDGMGNCAQPPATPCTPYVCGPTACLTTCSDDSSCGKSDFCDIANSACCSGLVAGGTIKVDSMAGSDSAVCCGLGSNQPCQTITKAMTSIDAAQASDVTIAATVGGGAGDWNNPNETYPIVLGWGAELFAPGVFFADLGDDQAEIFDIAPFSATDVVTTSASISGTATKAVGIGMSSDDTQLSDLSAIQVESGRTLYIANASVNGSATNQYAALTVAAGGSLTLGQDQTALNTGTVYIGNALNQSASDGWYGIRCLSDNITATGCTVTDATLQTSSVVFQGQEGYDIDAEDYATISLTSSPVIGIAPPGPGFGKCGTTKPDGSGMGLGSGEAVLLSGLSTMIFDNGTVQCIGANGFGLTATQNGSPVLTLDTTTIQNTETAIYASAGAVAISRSTIQFNYNGVVQNGTGAITLNGGKVGGVNNVVCSSMKESVNTLAINPGVCVLNQTSNALDASNVDWDTSGPDLFSCGALTNSSCTCEIMTCTDSPGADGMDAVDQDLGTVTTNNNGASAIVCSG